MKSKLFFLSLAVVFLAMLIHNLQASPLGRVQKHLCLGSCPASQDNDALEDDYHSCDTPSMQPRYISVSTVNATSVSGSYEPVVNADAYLVVISTNSNLGFVPVAGTSYTVGGMVGNGKVVKAGAGGAFTTEGLSANTNYYVYVFSMKISCPGGPVYRATNPTAVLVRTTTIGTHN